MKKFYIGFRSNPQLPNGGYHKAFGQLSKAEVKRKENPLYGGMRIWGFDTKEAYEAELARLRSTGERIM